MKTYMPILSYALTAAADVVAKRFIGFDGNYCAANGKAAGVSEMDADSGEQITVIGKGIAVVSSGGVIAAGDPIASDSVGKAVKASNVTISGAVPSGSTPVLSSGAQPTITSTPTGGVLPQAVNGYALDADSAGTGEVRVLLI